jgi:alkanesulfonate monooxygenase SsuD/methylene tetrahydromethanopterin reductase-like flavin-dependent oxidoreductase (luciferase family)
MAERQPELAVTLREPLPWADHIQLVRAAEESGYRAAFVPKVGTREAFAQLAGFAAATATLRVGTGVVAVGSRTPAIIAAGALTLHELSGERFVLGLGAGFGTLGDLSATAKETRAAMAANPLPVSAAPEVWFAALGDRAVALAAREADGVLLNWCTPERAAGAVEIVRRERGPDVPFTVAVYLRACLTGVDDGASFAALAEITRGYASIPHYLRQFEVMGFGAEARAAARGEPVPERLVDAICVRGGRDEVRARTEAFAAAGVDLVAVYPVPAREPVSSMLGTILTAAPDPTVAR